MNKQVITLSDRAAERVKEIISKYSFEVDEIAFMGDDLPDLPAFEEVSLRLCPKNAHPQIRSKSDWISKNFGGSGAVREAAEVILHFQSHLNTLFCIFLWSFCFRITKKNH